MDIIREISRLVDTECKKESNPYGYESSWEHINHVVKFARLLAREMNADEEIVEIAAWLHDLAAAQGFHKDHHFRGAMVAEEILKKFNYPKERVERVKHCIFAHRSSRDIKRETIEAECVANADAIAHFLEIPQLLCSKCVQEHMTVKQAMAQVRKKLERDRRKLTILRAQEIVAPFREAFEIILHAHEYLLK